MRGNRNQKLILVASIMLVIFLGIGFAAFSNTLTITPQATVNPDSSTFSVVFTKTSGAVDTAAVTPTKTPSSITATNGSIVNTPNPTISGLSATFTEPGQKVEYNFYVYNNGQYLAYLNSVSFKSSKVCFPGQDTTASLVSSACSYITMKVKIGDTTYDGTTQNITGNNLTVGQSEAVKVTIEYASGAPRADGDFSVSFPDVSLYYVTATGQNEQYVSTYTGTIYRNSQVPVASQNSDSVSSSGTAYTLHPWCMVVPGLASSCIDNEYDVHATFVSKEVCEAALEAILNNPEAEPTMVALAQNAVCEQGSITYETSASNINANVYLKHEVSNDKIIASYACIKYTEGGVNKEACVKGYDTNAYGTYTGMSSNYVGDVSNLNPTKNIAVISGTHDYFINNSGSCDFYDSHSHCLASSLSLGADSDGSVGAYDSSASWHCRVYSDGNSNCYSD